MNQENPQNDNASNPIDDRAPTIGENKRNYSHPTEEEFFYRGFGEIDPSEAQNVIDILAAAGISSYPRR